MIFLKFMLTIFCLYLGLILFGGAILSGDITCLFGASVWVAAALIIWPVFRKTTPTKTEED